MKAKASKQDSGGQQDLCNNCEKPLTLCVCSLIRPICTKTKVLILQHPQEPDKLLGSARLASLIIPESKLHIGLSCKNIEKAWGKATERSQWAVLYVGSVHLPKPDHSKKSALLPVSKKGKILEGDANYLDSIKGIIALDGTWSQAKTLWWRNPWLSKLKRLVLLPPYPSLYRELRKEPRPESLSTLETLAYSLATLENNQQIIEDMLLPFRALLKTYRGLNSK